MGEDTRLKTPSGNSAMDDTNNAVRVNVVTGSANNTQYAVDTALGTTPTGTLCLAIRDDALGTLTPVEGDAIGLRVDANGALWVAVSGTVTEASGAAIAASASVLDDWDESDRAKVNPIVGQAGVQGGSGAVSALTQRVVLATDVGLPTGTNAIGAVTQSGTWTVQPGNTANTTAWKVDGSAVTQPISAAAALAVSGGVSTLNGTTSQQVKGSAGSLVGIFVASSSSGTIKLWNNTAASGTVLVNTFSAVAATWYPLPFPFGTGLYITVGGTIDYSISYN